MKSTINITHYLNKGGNIPNDLPAKARKMAEFATQVVSMASIYVGEHDISTGVKCFKSGCKGEITACISSVNDDVIWKCNRCDNEGNITGWQNSRWDYSQIME
jgi:hypothetical protein